jgi:DnaK suppressor protein
MCINKLCRKCAYDEFTGNKTCKWSCEMKNELQQESLRQLLLAQKVQLVEKMKLERGGARSRAEAAVAQLSSLEQSHAQNITERETAFAMQEHNMDELGAVELALQRIASGEYGRCHVCDAEIPITRLLAFPSAMRCIPCQTAAEKTAGPNAAFH